MLTLMRTLDDTEFIRIIFLWMCSFACIFEEVLQAVCKDMLFRINDFIISTREGIIWMTVVVPREDCSINLQAL